MADEFALQVVRLVIPLEQKLIRSQEQQPRLNIGFKRGEM
jgi:hypothetical protein